MKDYILAKGDILASLLFSKLFPEATWKDSRNFILTNGNFGAPEVLWKESCNAVKQELDNQNKQLHIYTCNNLEETIKTAKKVTKPGEIVLFSPASASFDMFKNAVERGKKYKEFVQKL